MVYLKEKKADARRIACLFGWEEAVAQRRNRTRYRAYHRRADFKTPPRWNDQEVARRWRAARADCAKIGFFALGWSLRLCLDTSPVAERRVILREFYAWRKQHQRTMRWLVATIEQVKRGLVELFRPFTEALAQLTPAYQFSAADLVPALQLPRPLFGSGLQGPYPGLVYQPIGPVKQQFEAREDA
jgi:hypothetical protein